MSESLENVVVAQQIDVSNKAADETVASNPKLADELECFASKPPPKPAHTDEAVEVADAVASGEQLEVADTVASGEQLEVADTVASGEQLEVAAARLLSMLSKATSAADWCKMIIKRQSTQEYNSLTSPVDFNHIVKSSMSILIRHLKGEFAQSIELDKTKAQKALNILLDYLHKNNHWKPDNSKPLSERKLKTAAQELTIPLYRRSDRKFNDPSVRGQNYALFSFQPTQGATPDMSGVYGFIKIRGAFNRIEEAEEKSKELIQYFSANQIFIVEVGSSVPVMDRVTDPENVLEIENPNNEHLPFKTGETISMKEKREMEEIKRRSEELKKDVLKDPSEKEPIERYLELVQKRSTAAFLYTQHQEKLEECKNIVLRARQQIRDMNDQYPSLQNEYMEHYEKTCAERGLDKATDNMAVMIKKYFGEDPDLGF